MQKKQQRVKKERERRSHAFPSDSNPAPNYVSDNLLSFWTTLLYT